jgi:hypothetical protein
MLCERLAYLNDRTAAAYRLELTLGWRWSGKSVRVRRRL